MAKQVINNGTFIDDPTAESIYAAFGKVNANFTELYAPSGSTQYVQYVSKSGTDANDGFTWGNAKLTVAAALAALPATSGRPTGYVRVGRGTFTETAVPMVIGPGCFIEGMGQGGAAPTRIQPANSTNTHLFQCTNTSSQNHGLVLKDMELHGNKANQSGSADANLIELAGGYSCYLLNVALSNAAKWGIHMVGGYMTVQMIDVVGAACGSPTQGGWIFADNTQPGGIFNIDGFQVDQCGVYPFLIQYVNDGGGPKIELNHGKMEQQDSVNTTLHTQCIRYLPRTTGVGNPLTVAVRNCIFINTQFSAGELASAIGEANNAGLAAHWTIEDCECRDGYAKVFSSDKTGFSSAGSDPRKVRRFSYHSDRTIPYLQFGPVGIFSGAGTPEGAIVANIGSKYYRTDGSSDTCTYTKTSGTSNTGWVATIDAPP